MKRTRSRVIGFAVLSAFFSAAARADTVEDVEKKLHEAALKLKSLQFRSVTDQNIEYSGVKSKSKTDSKMELLRSDGKWKWRAESKTQSETDMAGTVNKQDATSLSVLDGETMWTLSEMSGAKTCMRKKAGPDEQMAFDVKKQFEQLRTMADLKLLPDEKVDGKDCWALELVAKPGSPLAAAGGGKTVNYYDKSTGVMMKSISTDKDGKTVSTSTVTELKIDGPIDADRFKFTPPAGVTVTDLDKIPAHGSAGEAPASAPTQP